MNEVWSFFKAGFDSVTCIDGCYYVDLGEAVLVCFFVFILTLADVVFMYFVGKSLFAIVKSLIQRFIYPGRNSSGKEPDKNK